MGYLSVNKRQYNSKREPHGYWERYYPNGQLAYKGNHKNGKRGGYWESYWDNGKLCYKGYYKDGEMDGYWEAYYDNGKLREIVYFIN